MPPCSPRGRQRLARRRSGNRNQPRPIVPALASRVGPQPVVCPLASPDLGRRHRVKPTPPRGRFARLNPAPPTKGLAAIRRTGGAGGQLSKPICKRVCKRDANGRAEMSETRQPLRDEMRRDSQLVDVLRRSSSACNFSTLRRFTPQSIRDVLRTDRLEIATVADWKASLVTSIRISSPQLRNEILVLALTEPGFLSSRRRRHCRCIISAAQSSNSLPLPAITARST
jgi:hypothetical protein